MYLRILKKDLKRKKTLNIILLLFVIMSSMFASSSVNNILAIMGGLDNYFDKAGIGDYCIISKANNDLLSDMLDNEPEVNSYRCEEQLMYTTDKIHINGNENNTSSENRWCFFISVDNCKLNFFDSDNDKIVIVPKGEVYVTTPMIRDGKLSVGDELEISLGSGSVKLKVKGVAKDALLGSEIMSNSRFIMNPEDYAALTSDKEASDKQITKIFYIDTDDVSTLKQSLAGSSAYAISFDGDRNMLKTANMIKMLVAILLLIVSSSLIILSFVVLKFTIGFTIAEEFREIGVMKAMGFKNSSIRALYITKYSAIAAVGTVIGYFAGLPLGNILLEKVSSDIVLESKNSVLIGAFVAAAVFLLILWFSWIGTSKIKKLSPIDAVRCGQTGERFKRKSLMHLGKSRLGTTGYLAANDVLSSPKEFSIITIVFTLCAMMIMMLSAVANTMNSSKLVYLFSVTDSDVYIDYGSDMVDVMNGSQPLSNVLEKAEKELADNDMPADVFIEVTYKLSVTHNDKQLLMHFTQCKSRNPDTIDTSKYAIYEGKFPEYPNEIALTKVCADELDAEIGDTIMIDIEGKNEEFIISGYFDSMNQMGLIGRLNQHIQLSDDSIATYFSLQASFTDSPSKKVKNERIDTLKSIHGDDNVQTTSEFVASCFGVTDTIVALKKFVIILSVIIILLITVLMEKSFITKEKSEIALMKAIGFKNSSVIAQHVMRFFIVSVIASFAGAAISHPITSLTMKPVFEAFGVRSSMNYDFSAVETLIFFPAIIIAATIIGTFLTALNTRRIRSSDTADIE